MHKNPCHNPLSNPSPPHPTPPHPGSSPALWMEPPPHPTPLPQLTRRWSALVSQMAVKYNWIGYREIDINADVMDADWGCFQNVRTWAVFSFVWVEELVDLCGEVRGKVPSWRWLIFFSCDPVGELFWFIWRGSWVAWFTLKACGHGRRFSGLQRIKGWGMLKSRGPPNHILSYLICARTHSHTTARVHTLARTATPPPPTKLVLWSLSQLGPITDS